MHWITFALLFIFSCEVSQGEQIAKHYTVNDGLPSNLIWFAAVDKNNIKWFGTDLGIASFDGVNWKTYQFEGLTSNQITALAVDKTNVKWFGLEEAVLSFDENNWKTYRLDNIEHRLPFVVSKIAIDVDNSKWFIYSSGIVDAARTVGASQYKGDVWTHYSVKDGLPSNLINSIAIDRNGVKWFGSGGPYGTGFPIGLTSFDNLSWTDYSSLISGYNSNWSNYVKQIAIDSNNKLWIEFVDFMGEQGSVQKFDGAKLDTGYPDTRLISEGLQDVVWFRKPWGRMNPESVDSLLIGYDGENKKEYSYSENLFSPLIDRKGINWFSTPTGVVSSDGVLWKKYTLSGQGGGIVVDSTNVKWRFTSDDGIWSISDDSTVLVEETEVHPAGILNIRCYPNPFNPSTTIEFTIPKAGKITLAVYSINGQKIATLVNGSVSIGTHSVKFDGSKYASGVYFYRFESAGLTRTGKMLLLK